MAKLEIKDVRAKILDYERYHSKRAGLLYEFFEFWPIPRNFHDPIKLSDCFFFNLHIGSYVTEWVPGVPPPPDPSAFSQAFSTLLKTLAGENVLTLHVKSLDPDYFDPLKVIKEILQPQNLDYMLLRFSKKQDNQGGVSTEGALFFEWPTTNLEYVVDNWFMSPQVTIEGYISTKSVLPKLAELFGLPDTEERLRELLRAIEIGFKIWQDFNGLFVLTDRLDLPALRERLHSESFRDL